MSEKVISTAAVRTLRIPAMLAVMAIWLASAQAADAVEAGGSTGTTTRVAMNTPIEGIQVCARSVTNRDYPGGKADEGCATRSSYFESTPVPMGGRTTTPGIDASLTETGQLTGSVIDVVTKAPIAGIEACARTPTQARDEASCAATDAEGKYLISGLLPGGYLIQFSTGSLNYLPETPMRDYSRGVTVTSGTTASATTLELQGGGQVTGTVTNALTKTGLEGVEVCALGDGPSLATTCTKTASSGTYTISGLEHSAYFVGFSPKVPYLHQYYRGANSRAEASTINVTEGAVVSGIDAELQVGGQITGQVTTRATKAPMPGVQVCANENDGERVLCATTDVNGLYTIAGLASGSDIVEFVPPENGLNYRLQYWDHRESLLEAEKVSVTAGATTSGINAELWTPYGEIAGRVVDGGSLAPLGEIQVCATARQGNSVTRCAKTNTNGEYTIAHLLGGEYVVEFSSYPTSRYVTQYYSGASSAAGATAVTVVAGELTSGINATMLEAGANAKGGIAGRATAASTEAAIVGLQVCALQSTSELLAKCATTGANGEYSITGLAAGAYVVEFFSPPDGELNYIAEFYNGKSSPEEANIVSVTGGSVAQGIDARLVEGGRVTGKVVDGHSQGPIAGIEVCAYMRTGGGIGAECTVTGVNGEYALAALPGGEYTVEYSPPPESTLNYARQFYPGRSTRAEANPVRVTAGQLTAGIDAELLLGGTITGRVTAASNGAGLKEVFVCALQSLNEGTGCALTSASGEYTIRWLPPGTYAVGFADKGYAIQYYNEKCAFAEADSVTVTGGFAASAINAVLRTGCGSVPPNPIGRLLEPPSPVSPPAAPMPTGETAPLKASVVARPSVVSLSNLTVAVSRDDIASLRLSCHGRVRCHAKVTLWVTNTALKAGRRARRTVLLGNTTVTIAAGPVTTVKIKLRRAARVLLSARSASVSARITIAELETGLTRTVLVHLVRDTSPSRR